MIYSYSKIVQKISSHFSFIIILGSSVLYFLFNLWLKSVFSPAEYGEYGLLNGFLNIAMSFGVIGGDQLLMRTAVFDKDLTIQKSVLRFNYLLLAIFVFAGPYIFFIFFSSSVNLFLLSVCSLLSGLTMLTFSIFRISHLFTAAQIQKNLWRLITFLLSIAVFFAFPTYFDINFILIAVNIGLILSIVLSPFSFRKFNINLISTEKPDYRLWFGFTVAMALMSLMTNADRFLIDKYVGRTEVGNFFFLQNLFLFPLSQVQTYSGFKEITTFKKNFSVSMMKRSLSKNFFIAITLSGVLFSGFWLLVFLLPKNIVDEYFYKSNDYTLLIILLLLNGIIRVVYSVLSAAMGAVGNRKAIRATNILTLIFYGIIYILFATVIGLNLISITLMFFLFWLVRAIFFYFYLSRL